jgi:glycosyltransferase involved in cell wall biosynthesis
LLTLASVLREQGIGICIATQGDSDLFRAAEDQRLDTVAVQPLGVLREQHGALFGGNAVYRLVALFSLLVQNVSIAWKIRKYGADVVWIRSSKGIAFAGLGTLLNRRPLVWDVDYELPSQGAVRWLHRIALWAAERVIFQYSAAPDVIFGSELAMRYRHKFQTIIPGIELRSLEPCWEKRMTRRRRTGDPFVVLQVGTICNRKNQQLLIDALSQVRDARPNESIQVQLVGGVFEESYAKALKDNISNAGLDGNVKFLGWRRDVHRLMASADLLAMPSKDEGVPNTVQEAMAIGLPVLVSDAGGMPEIVTEGETGWVLELNNPVSWASRITWCLRNRQALTEVGARAAQYARENFGTRNWGTEYAQIIATCGGVGRV